MSVVSPKKERIPLWFWLPALLGLIAALITWWLIGTYIQQQVEERPRLPALPIEEYQVIVPGENIVPGTVIQLEHLAMRHLPASALPTDVFFDTDVENLIGRVVVKEIHRGKAIQQLHLIDQSARKLSEQISRGYTAFTLPLEFSWTHAQSVQPGDMFDFYATESNGWHRLLSSIQLLALAPQLSALEQVEHSSRTFTHAIFQVPIHTYARLVNLQQRQQLKPVLKTVHPEVGPEYLSVPLDVEIIQPGSHGSIGEEWL